MFDFNTAKTRWITPDAEEEICYCARVSSPNQDNRTEEDNKRLIKYCIKNKHWSIFSQADWSVEIHTIRAVSQQILRHASFDFQEFSQRYAEFRGLLVAPPMRGTHPKNRQKSVPLDAVTGLHLDNIVSTTLDRVLQTYNYLIENGVAKETARMILPECTPTRLFMKGSVRSWIHYLEVRRGNGTQLEHIDLADKIHVLFEEEFPLIAQAVKELEMENV
jgi:thymidylate synthase (FAD)